MIAAWYAKEGRRRGWTWFALAAVPWGVAGVFHEVLAAGSIHPVLGPIFLGQIIPAGTAAPTAPLNVGLIVLTLVPTYVWFIAFAVQLYRRVDRPDAVPDGAGLARRTTASAG